MARDDPAPLEGFLPVLTEQLRLAAEELRREADSGVPDEAPERRVRLRSIRANLVEAVSRVIIRTSGTAIEREAFTDFVAAVTTDLDEGTLRVAARALFVSAAARSRELASAAELLDELLVYPDAVVQAWAAGAVGRVATNHPDAIAASAVDLRRLLTHQDGTVQHNAVEALAALVGPRPYVVAPAADTLRDLLYHEEVAIQHNAAGVLYVLAEHRLEAVMPAVEALRDLRDHDEEAVSRVAIATLARLARERPGDASGSKPGRS